MANARLVSFGVKIHTKKIKLFLDSEANFDEYITMVREEIKAKLLSCLNY